LENMFSKLMELMVMIYVHTLVYPEYQVISSIGSLTVILLVAKQHRPYIRWRSSYRAQSANRFKLEYKFLTTVINDSKGYNTDC